MSFIGDQELVGKILSVAGLALAPCTTLFARHYSRTLYFGQFLYVIAVLNTVNTGSIVSDHLEYTGIDFSG